MRIPLYSGGHHDRGFVVFRCAPRLPSPRAAVRNGAHHLQVHGFCRVRAATALPPDLYDRRCLTALQAVGPLAPPLSEAPMEGIYLDCGAGGPQLKRNPLDSATNSRSRASIRIDTFQQGWLEDLFARP